MRDFSRLREHLRAALLVAPLLYGGCDVVVGTAGAQTPPSPPPSPPNLPSCPTGDFCATATQMKHYAAKKSPTELGCPTEIPQAERKNPPKGMPGNEGVYFSFDAETTKAKHAAGDKNACCYKWTELCPGGRPLLDEEGAQVRAAPRLDRAWARAPRALRPRRLPADQAARAARAWLEDALAEHASIASFARVTQELLALGAPPDLVAAVQRAALDEVRHAERCFALASFHGGTPVGPGPVAALSARPADLLRFARDTFIEGCVGETISALACARAASRVNGAEGDVWRMLAADEARHAALAWRTLAWALSGLPDSARAELAALAVPAIPSVADVGDDEPIPGRLSPAELAAVHADAWREVILPTLAGLG